GWFLTDFPTALAIAICYLLFVLFGSLIMSFLPAIPGLYPLKFLYNVTQIMLCSYMCIEAGIRAYSAGYTLLPCEPFDETNAPLSFILYVFYISKVLDFMDTFFIIAEKRWKQLSFLHVYHHTSIFLFYWLNVHVSYDGDIYLTIVLNGLIHTMMYTYYFITLHTKDVWWKSALTLGQMIQFLLMNAQAGYLLYYKCNSFPRNVLIAYAFYIFSLLILFANFFVMSYMTGGSKKDKKKKA
ncbi:unnamed protein product, partial [Ectocarpus fasciculatus]